MNTSDLKKIKILFLPQKLQKKRYEAMINTAHNNNFALETSLSDNTTHIVTEISNVDQLCKLLKIECLNPNIKITKVLWLVNCLKNKKLHDPTTNELMEITGLKIMDDRINANEKNCTIGTYACMKKTPLIHKNEKCVSALEILAQNAFICNDESRQLAFQKAASVLKSLSFEVKRIDQVKKLNDIGNHSLRVIKEILDDGVCSEVNEIQTSEWYIKMNLFISVYGVGPMTAKKWINFGAKTIEDVKQLKVIYSTLDTRTKFGIAFYNDLNKKISKDQAISIKKLIDYYLHKIEPNCISELVGGFRRGKPFGHDVDVLLTHPNLGQETCLITKLVNVLNDNNLFLHGHIESHKNIVTGSSNIMDSFDKWIGIMKIPTDLNANILELKQNTRTSLKRTYKVMDNNEDVTKELNKLLKKENVSSFENLLITAENENRDWFACRVDIIVAPIDQFYYALVGWTGNKWFNRSLRLYSDKVLNLKLSSHGLINSQTKASLPATSEKNVFDNLKLEYIEPCDRNC